MWEYLLYTNIMAEKKSFNDLRDEILRALAEKIKEVPNNEGGFTLIDGFGTIMLKNEISGDIVFGGPVVPTVMVVGNKTGLIYTFALKVLLPKFEM